MGQQGRRLAVLGDGGGVVPGEIRPQRGDAGQRFPAPGEVEVLGRERSGARQPAELPGALAEFAQPDDDDFEFLFGLGDRLLGLDSFLGRDEVGLPLLLRVGVLAQPGVDHRVGAARGEQGVFAFADRRAELLQAHHPGGG